MQKKKTKMSFYFGNLLIFLGILLLGYIYLPFLMIYLNPPKIEPTEKLNGYFVTVPKIHAQAPVIENVDPWNEVEYKIALKKGVAQAKNTSYPGDGITYLYAHSSDDPWRITKYNTIFLRLSEMQNGDEIILAYNNKDYKYIVFDKKVLWPAEIKYLKEAQTKVDSPNTLILQTCTPVGTAFKRLLVFAKPI